MNRCLIVMLLLLSARAVLGAPANPAAARPASSAPDTLAAALSPRMWNQVEQSIDRALVWLSRQQSANGSFSSPVNAEPAATSFAVMAFLSRGHIPGQGPYGAQLDRAIDYVLAQQQPDGLLASGFSTGRTSGKSANYNHGIAGLMLTEAYGMTDPARAARLKPAIVKALQYTRRVQTEPKDYPQEQGGLRYQSSYGSGESDLSVTAWHLMFLRSAKNAEFDVPRQYVDDAVGYVMRCWDDRQGVFYYRRNGSESRWSRGMVGAGALSLAMAGQHNTPVAQRAGDWMVAHPFRFFGERVGGGDRFYYSAYYCSQAMAQLGGRHWREFFPPLVSVLLNGQRPSGEWPVEPASGDRIYGNVYTTAMAVLSLTPPLQLLPVYQR